MELKSFYVKGTRQDALTFLSDSLEKEGYVKEGYRKSLLEREQKYPTGLALADSVNVAIPHTETELANEDVFVVAVPQSDMKFGRIDKPSDEILVDLIFLFVIRNPDKYLKVLSALTEHFLNKDFLGYMKDKNLEEIQKYLRKYILQ